MTIENSFGRLKGLWKCLQFPLDVGTTFACTVIAACVILHKVCEMHKEGYIEEWNNVLQNHADIGDRKDTAVAAQNAIRLRDNNASASANNAI